MQPGTRTLIIASINPGNFATQDTKVLQRHKIHIAAIQETHIPVGQNYKLNGYRIITTSEIIKPGNKQGIAEGGVAVLIHEDIEQHIIHIRRINHRIVKITLRSEESNTPCNNTKLICATPRKTKTKQQEHWKEVHGTLRNVPTEQFAIWFADANRRIGKIGEEEEKPWRISGP